MFRKVIVAGSIVVLAAGSTACATKGFVRQNVGEVNDKVDSLGRSVEDTQERTRRNEGRITEVDQRAGAAEQSAAKANTAAAEAQTSANAANAAANAAGSKADKVDAASRRLVFEVVLSEDQGNFKFNKAELPDEAKARLDQLITDLKADPKGAYFEIEGHTDNVGETAHQPEDRARARRSGEAVPVRAAPDSAPQDQRDQLRRRQASRAQQDAGRPRAEPPGGGKSPRVVAPHPGVAQSTVFSRRSPVAFASRGQDWGTESWQTSDGLTTED